MDRLSKNNVTTTNNNNALAMATKRITANWTMFGNYTE